MAPDYSTAYSHFPPLSTLAWLVPLYLQALLLHPRFPAGPSRVLRLALALPAVYLAWHAPTKGFEPRDITRGLNAAYAFVTMYALAKAIEFGTAIDRRSYEWVGWGQQAKGKDGSGESSDDDKAENKLAGIDTSQDSWLRVAISALHLVSSFRMIGYRAWSGRPPKPISTRTFLLRTTARLIGTHLGTLVTIGFLALPDPKRHRLLVSAVPSLGSHPVALEWASEVVGYCSFGFAAWQGLACTHAVVSLVFFALNHVGRMIGLPLDPFDGREYIPLFRAPYYPTSVRRFWSTQMAPKKSKGFNVSVKYANQRSVMKGTEPGQGGEWLYSAPTAGPSAAASTSATSAATDPDYDGYDSDEDSVWFRPARVATREPSPQLLANALHLQQPNTAPAAGTAPAATATADADAPPSSRPTSPNPAPKKKVKISAEAVQPEQDWSILDNLQPEITAGVPADGPADQATEPTGQTTGQDAAAAAATVFEKRLDSVGDDVEIEEGYAGDDAAPADDAPADSVPVDAKQAKLLASVLAEMIAMPYDELCSFLASASIREIDEKIGAPYLKEIFDKLEGIPPHFKILYVVAQCPLKPGKTTIIPSSTLVILDWLIDYCRARGIHVVLLESVPVHPAGLDECIIGNTVQLKTTSAINSEIVNRITSQGHEAVGCLAVGSAASRGLGLTKRNVMAPMELFDRVPVFVPQELPTISMYHTRYGSPFISPIVQSGLLVQMAAAVSTLVDKDLSRLPELHASLVAHLGLPHNFDVAQISITDLQTQVKKKFGFDAKFDTLNQLQELSRVLNAHRGPGFIGLGARCLPTRMRQVRIAAMAAKVAQLFNVGRECQLTVMTTCKNWRWIGRLPLVFKSTREYHLYVSTKAGTNLSRICVGKTKLHIQGRVKCSPRGRMTIEGRLKKEDEWEEMVCSLKTPSYGVEFLNAAMATMGRGVWDALVEVDPVWSSYKDEDWIKGALSYSHNKDQCRLYFSKDLNEELWKQNPDKQSLPVVLNKGALVQKWAQCPKTQSEWPDSSGEHLNEVQFWVHPRSHEVKVLSHKRDGFYKLPGVFWHLVAKDDPAGPVGRLRSWFKEVADE